MSKTLYRVYDPRDVLHASYDDRLPQAKEWANQCAQRVNGRVERVEISSEGEKKTEE
jgi:hypothetical protein